ILDVKDVIVRSNFNEQRIRVSDIAEVKDDYEKKVKSFRTNGENSLNLIVKRKGDADVLNLSDDISRIIEQYQTTYRQQGIKIIKLVDYSYYTRSLLSIVTNNAVIGFFLVLGCLFLFLNVRTAFWVA